MNPVYTTTQLHCYSMGDDGMKMVSFNLFMNNDIKYLFFLKMYSSLRFVRRV